MCKTGTNYQCLQCGNEFYRSPCKKVSEKWKPYCSNKCRIARRNKCQTCETEFYAAPSRIAKFCSKKCYSKSMEGFKGAEHPQWKGGRFVRKDGYVLVRNPKKPLTSILEHRLVMANHIGRELRTNEHVHHKNENKSDNTLDNLELLSHGEHTTLHRKKELKDKSMSLVKCVYCSVEFYKRNDQLKITKRNFCSKQHWYKFFGEEKLKKETKRTT
jgi:hypothetical protein